MRVLLAFATFLFLAIKPCVADTIGGYLFGDASKLFASKFADIFLPFYYPNASGTLTNLSCGYTSGGSGVTINVRSAANGGSTLLTCQSGGSNSCFAAGPASVTGPKMYWYEIVLSNVNGQAQIFCSLNRN